MIRFCLIAVLVVSATLHCPAQLRFQTEVLDLGDLLQLECKDLKLTIVNDGTSDVKVSRLGLNCACMTSKTDPFELGQGQSRVVQIKLRTKMLHGVHRQHVLAYYGDKGAKVCQMEVRFTVHPDLVVKPAAWQLGAIRPGETRKRSFIVQSRNGISPNLVLPTQTHDVDVKMSTPVETETGRTWTIALSVTLPKNAKAGRMDRTLRFGVKGARIENVELHILGTIETDLQVRPSSIKFGRVSNRREGKVVVTIRSLSSKPFRLTNALDNGEVFADFDDKKTGPSHVVVLQMPKGQKLGRKYGIIKLTTNHPDVPVIELRYRGMVVKDKK